MLELILLLLLGVFIHIFLKLKTAVRKPEFQFRVFFKKHIIGTIFIIICGVTVVILREEIFLAYGILINKTTAVFMGYSGDSVFKKLMKNKSDKVGSLLK